MTAVAAVIAALAYWIRRQVHKKPSVEEQFRTLVLHRLKAAAQSDTEAAEFRKQVTNFNAEISRAFKDLFRLIREKPCPWSEGRVPEQYQQRIEAAMTRIELMLERLPRKPGGQGR